LTNCQRIVKLQLTPGKLADSKSPQCRADHGEYRHMTMHGRPHLLGAALALMAAPALAQNWDMPTPYGDGIFHTQNHMQFAEDVRERPTAR
jgi:hypothetical protein